MSKEDTRYGLPIRPFLYSPDQIASLLDVELRTLMDKYLFLVGVHMGKRPADRIMARNIAPEDEQRDWRVAEKELVRWLRYKGYRLAPAAYLLR